MKYCLISGVKNNGALKKLRRAGRFMARFPVHGDKRMATS